MTFQKFLVFSMLMGIAKTATGQMPHIAGIVTIDVERGLILADITMTNLPAFIDPVLVLNQGMNIQYIKCNGKTVPYNTDFGIHTKNDYLSNGIAYSLVVDSINSQTSISLKYRGAFPVYHNSLLDNSYNDDQSKIVFKNNILRASYTSKWYPFFYDRETNALLTKFTANLKFVCNVSVTSIYINGAKPVSGNSAKVKVSQANNLPLYIGNYAFKEVNNTWFLNTAASALQKIAIAGTVNTISAFYEKILLVENKNYLVLAQIFSTGRPNQYNNWALADYPLIMMDVNRMSDIINAPLETKDNISDYRIIAHELAHQYWGLTIQANNNYRGFFSESLAEYFALKAIEQKYGVNKYVAFIKENYMKEQVLKRRHPPLDSLAGIIINNNYWYNYYSLCLLGLEYVIGKEKMNLICRNLLHHNDSQKMDFMTLQKAIFKAGVTNDEYKAWHKQFVNTDNCLKGITDYLTKMKSP
jgi:hypothetical protein